MPDETPTSDQARFGVVWKWLNDVLASRDLSGNNGDAWKVFQGSLNSFNAQCCSRSDIFKHALNAVPDPTIGIPDVNKAIANYKTVEAAAESTKTALATINSKRDEVYEQIGALTSKKEDLKSAQTTEQSLSERLARQILEAMVLQETRAQELQNACKDLKDAI